MNSGFFFQGILVKKINKYIYQQRKINTFWKTNGAKKLVAVEWRGKLQREQQPWDPLINGKIAHSELRRGRVGLGWGQRGLGRKKRGLGLSYNKYLARKEWERWGRKRESEIKIRQERSTGWLRKIKGRKFKRIFHYYKREWKIASKCMSTLTTHSETDNSKLRFI